MLKRLNQVFVLLATWTLAAPAHASFGSFGPWEGVALLLAFVLTLTYGFIIDLVVLARLFRHRATVVVVFIVTLAVIVPLLGLAALPTERAGFFKVFSTGLGPAVLGLTSAVLIPFLFVAPTAQYKAISHGRPSPAWIARWMALQPALLLAFIVLPVTNYYYGQRSYAAGLAEARGARPGELGALVERAEQRPGRIWGTGLPNPWGGPDSSWIGGLAIGLDRSALIATHEPLDASDRAALRALVDRPRSYAVPHVRAKLLWDALEPGSFSATLDPELPFLEETVAVLLERLEQDGEARLCPGGPMMAADRAALNALLLAKGRIYEIEMRPPWDSYQQRAEQLCSGGE